MVNRIVSVGDDFALPAAVKVLDTHLPTRLSEGSLSATYATTTALAGKADTSAVAAKLDRTQGGWEYLRTRNSTALQNWFAALGNRDNAPAKMVVIGDSVTEGSGASARPSTKRWIDGVRDRLRTRYPTTGIGAGGGIGYIPTQYAGGSVAAPTNYSGSNSADNANGLGMRARVLNPSAAVQWNGVQGTAVDLFYLKGNSSRILTYKVDGGTGTALETNSGTGAVTDTGVQRISLGASGVHTVNVQQTGGGAVYPEGIYVYDGDEAKGIHVYDAGHHGFETTEFAASTSHAARVASVNANLVIIALGENDFLHDKSSATMRTNLGKIVDDIKAAQANPDPSFLFLINFQANYTTPAEPYQNYVDAAYLAAADKGAAVLDLSLRMPRIGNTDLGLYSDLYHPNDKGYAMMADPIMEALSPR